MGFPRGSVGKESSCNVGDLGLSPGLGRSPGGGKGYPRQDSGLENSMDCNAHRVTKSQTQLSDCHFHLAYTLQLDIHNNTERRAVLILSYKCGLRAKV